MKFLKKIFSKIFSKTTFTFLAIILQLGFYFLLDYLLERIMNEIPGRFGPFTFSGLISVSVNLIISLFFIVRIVIRDMPPDAKVSWIILIAIAPIAGALLYLLFSQQRLSRKKFRHFAKIREDLKEYITSDNDYSDLLGPYAGISRYLYNEANAIPHRYSDIEYFPTGELFWDALVRELEKAEKYIFMEYFIIDYGVMWSTVEDILLRKKAQGVVIKLMYDDFGCIPHVGTDFCKKMRKKGIECYRFNKFTPLATARHNNRDHRKITVIDGRVGFMGGTNIADEYVNITHPFGQWKDSSVMLKGAAVQNLITLFISMYGSLTNTDWSDISQYIPEYYEDYGESTGILQPFGDGPKPVFKDHVAEKCILDMINRSTEYMYIMTPYLIIDNNLQSALCSAAQRGVDVRIITPRIPDKKIVFWITRRNYINLNKAGVKIYEYLPGFIHSKCYLSDDTLGLCGTMNMDYRSLLHHFECGVWMYKTTCLRDMKADFEATFAVSELMTEETIKQTLPKRIVSAIGSIFSPLL